MNRFLLSILFFTVLISAQPKAATKEINWPKIYTEELFHITEVMVTDVASPPVAARIYAYSTLAAYLITKESREGFENQNILEHTYLADQDWEITDPAISSPEFSAIYAMLNFY